MSQPMLLLPARILAPLLMLLSLASTACTSVEQAAQGTTAAPRQAATSAALVTQEEWPVADLRWQAIVCEPGSSPPWCERWVQRAPTRADPFVIIGPYAFVQSVLAVLADLRSTNPPRYAEALWYLPRAFYWPDNLKRKHPSEAAADSDGDFAVDVESLGYDGFRFIFLHEAGHNVMGTTRTDWSEAAANAYAAMVLAELRAPVRFGMTAGDWPVVVRPALRAPAGNRR